MTQRKIARFWLPLAAMWILMALEQPLLSAVIARLPAAALNLAAYGLTFSVTALSGGVQVAATPLVADSVSAVFTENGQLSVETLYHGVVKYSDVKAVS